MARLREFGTDGFGPGQSGTGLGELGGFAAPSGRFYTEVSEIRAKRAGFVFER